MSGGARYGTATAVHGDVGSGATKKETSPRVIYAGSEGDWESTAPFVRLTVTDLMINPHGQKAYNALRGQCTA